MDRLCLSADKWMPVFQRLAFTDQSIGTGSWQPRQLLFVQRLDGETVRYLLESVAIIRTFARLCVEQAAGDASEVYLSRVLVFQLVHTASAAAIAQ